MIVTASDRGPEQTLHAVMNDVFGPTCAATYDTFYAGKDYEAGCHVIEHAFSEFSAQPVLRVLDVGCGTGGHTIPLASRGYDVIAVDRAAPMLACARAKAEATGVADRITFIPADVTTAPSVKPCDAAPGCWPYLAIKLQRLL